MVVHRPKRDSPEVFVAGKLGRSKAGQAGPPGQSNAESHQHHRVSRLDPSVVHRMVKSDGNRVRNRVSATFIPCVEFILRDPAFFAEEFEHVGVGLVENKEVDGIHRHIRLRHQGVHRFRHLALAEREDFAAVHA